MAAWPWLVLCQCHALAVAPPRGCKCHALAVTPPGDASALRILRSQGRARGDVGWVLGWQQKLLSLWVLGSGSGTGHGSLRVPALCSWRQAPLFPLPSTGATYTSQNAFPAQPCSAVIYQTTAKG